MCALPLEGPELLAQEALQVENLLHEKTLDGGLLSAGGVDPLCCLSPHQNLMLQLCRKTTNRQIIKFTSTPKNKQDKKRAYGRMPLSRMRDILFFNTIKKVRNKVPTMVLIHL